MSGNQLAQDLVAIGKLFDLNPFAKYLVWRTLDLEHARALTSATVLMARRWSPNPSAARTIDKWEAAAEAVLAKHQETIEPKEN